MVNAATDNKKIRKIDYLAQRKSPCLPKGALSKKESAPLDNSSRISCKNFAIQDFKNSIISRDASGVSVES